MKVKDKIKARIVASTWWNTLKQGGPTMTSSPGVKPALINNKVFGNKKKEEEEKEPQPPMPTPAPPESEEYPVIPDELDWGRD